MEIAVYLLMALATILFVVCGCIYSSHRIPSIVIFGIGVLITDAAVCLFWAMKTASVAASSNPSIMQFVEAPEHFTFSLTENGLVIQLLRAHLENRSFRLPTFDGINLGEIYVKSGALLINTELLAEGGSSGVKIAGNAFSIKPPAWDRNSNADALEIVDGNVRPVLQLIRRGPARIVIFGMFRNPDGRVLIADRRGVRSGARADPKVFDLPLIFKYPSWKFPGKFADGSN